MEVIRNDDMESGQLTASPSTRRTTILYIGERGLPLIDIHNRQLSSKRADSAADIWSSRPVSSPSSNSSLFHRLHLSSTQTRPISVSLGSDDDDYISTRNRPEESLFPQHHSGRRIVSLPGTPFGPQNDQQPRTFPRRRSNIQLLSRSPVLCRDDMASGFSQMSGDARRHWSGNRYENRPPVSRSTPCKNGPLCRKYQEGLGGPSIHEVAAC